MPIRSVTLRILGDGRSARSEMDWVNREADKLNRKKVTVDIEANTPEAKLAALRVKLQDLKNMHANIDVNVDDKMSQLAFARINQQLLRIDRMTAKPKISVEGLARAQAELASADLGFSKLMRSADAFGKDMEVQNTRLTRFFTPGRGGFGAMGAFFGGKVALFGGLAAIGTVHLLVDAIAEVLAVVIPATIALGAFGIAGMDAAKNIYTHMNNLHIVMDATNKVIPPMTGNMEKLHEAVRPAVYQIFGDALTIMNAKTGVFQKLALGTAGVLTHLAARMTVAINSGHGFGEFLRNAVPDVAKLGDAFGNLFGILGNLLHVMPGYANILLDFGDGVLKLGEYVTRVAEPIIGIGLTLHGFIVWAGLGASAAFFLGKAIVTLGTTTIGTAIKSFAFFIADLVTITLTEGVATAATFAFGAALDFISANPLVWVGAAVGGLAALVFWMSRSESTTQKWGDSLQKNIDNASSVTQGFQLTQSALEMTSNRLGAAAAKLANTQKFQTEVNLHTGASSRVLTQAYQHQQAVVDGLRGQTQRFSQEQQFNAGRLHGLTKAYGSQSNAMALLNAAGITQQEWQTKGADGWAIITQKINGTLAGYKAMGQTQGTLSNDLQVMDRGITDQYTAMQKLNQAWDQFISDVTGTQSTFDTSALGLMALSKNFNQTAKNAANTTHSLGEIKTAGTLAHSVLDGMSQGSLALNQAFSEQVGNTNAMIDSWRTAGVAGNLFTRGVKDSIAPMVRFARGSKEGTAQLVALAQEAGYNGPNSMKSLVKWLGNTHDSLQMVKKVTNQATEQEALLSGSMRSQGNLIANQLVGDINSGILAYTGVKKAAQEYGNAIAEDGRKSDQAKTARRNLINDIIATGRASGDTKNQIAAMISKVLNIPIKRALQIVMTGEGSYSVHQMSSKTNPFPGGISGRAADGMFINKGTGPRSDDVLIAASKGELVVPTHLVTKGAVDHLRGLIPGFERGGIIKKFANGGLVEQGNTSVLTGQQGVKDYNAFTTTMGNTLVSNMHAAMAKAIASLMSGSSSIVSDAMRWIGKIPYVWGGTRVPGGADCSGFVQTIYGRHGINAPRTSEAQGAWVRRSAPTPGGLAFYHSPTGGPDPGHVAIIGDNGKVISQGGGMGPQYEGLHFAPLLWTGVPPHGFGAAGGMGANGPVHGGVAGLARAMAAARGWVGAEWNALNAVEMREAGWRLNARNPSSGAYGIAQFINGPSEYAQYGGNASTAVGQVTGFLNYVSRRYGDPIRAWGHEQRFGWYADGTPAAAPGWAWVGERGPELVKMRGGETVLDAQSSRKITKGYAGGAGAGEILRGLSLLKAFVNDTSTTALWADMHRFLGDISKYYNGPKEAERRRLVKSQTDRLISIDRRLANVKGNIANEKAYQSSVFSNLSSYGGLSNLNLGPTAGVGDNVALSGGQGIKIQLNTKLANLKAFASALKKLHNMKLKNSLFRQIVDMGPDQGLPYANELISGGPSFIKQLNGIETDITHEEKSISQGAASSIYAGKYLTGDAYWRNLKNQKADLEKEFRNLGRILGLEAAKYFGVPRNRRHPKGFASGGILHEQVWGVGLSGNEYTFGEEGAEFFAPMRTPHSGGSRPGGDVYHIYVSGDTDPDGAALKIIQKVRDYKRHHGNQPTGIG